MNPMDLLKLKDRWNIFRKEHPKVLAFAREAGSKACMEGTIIEIKVTSPDGKSYESTMKLTAEDIKTIELGKKLRK